MSWLVSILLRATVVSIDKGIKTQFRAICKRESRMAPGSGSSEKHAVSTVKSLGGGRGSDREECGCVEIGAEGTARGRPSVWALEMSADHSAGERLGVGMIWGRDCGPGCKRDEEGSERVGICTGGSVTGFGTPMIVVSRSELSGREGIGTEATGTGSSSSSEDTGSRWVMSLCCNCFSELTCLL